MSRTSLFMRHSTTRTKIPTHTHRERSTQISTRTDTIRVGSVDHLMLIGLHDFESPDGPTFRQSRGRIVFDDGGHRIGVGLVPSAVQITRGGGRPRMGFVLRGVIVFGQDHRRTRVHAVGQCTTQFFIAHNNVGRVVTVIATSSYLGQRERERGV